MSETELDALRAPWPTMTIDLGIALAFSNVIGILANSMVIVIFLYSKNIRSTASNKFIVSLAISDLLFVSNHFISAMINLRVGHFAGGILECQLDGYITLVAAGTSLNSLLLIAMERYFTIVQNKYFSAKIVNVVIVSQWIGFAIMFGVIPMSGEHFRNNDGYLAFCTLDYSAPFSTASGILSFTILFFLFGCPFGIAMCYKLIFSSLSKAQFDLENAMTDSIKTNITKTDTIHESASQPLALVTSSGSSAQVSNINKSSVNVSEGLAAATAAKKTFKRDDSAEKGN